MFCQTSRELNYPIMFLNFLRNFGETRKCHHSVDDLQPLHTKGPVIRATFLFNLSRNIVALQVEQVVARSTTACPTCLATNFSVAS